MELEFDLSSVEIDEQMFKLELPELPVGTKIWADSVHMCLYQDERYLGRIDEDQERDYVFNAQELAKLDNPKTKGVFSKSLPNVTMYVHGGVMYSWGNQYVKGCLDTGKGKFYFHFAPSCCIRNMERSFIDRIEGRATPPGFAPHGFPMIHSINEKSNDGRIIMLRKKDLEHIVVKATQFALEHLKPYLADVVCNGNDFSFLVQEACGQSFNENFVPSFTFGLFERAKPSFPCDLKLYRSIAEHFKDAGNLYLRSIGIDDGWYDLGNYNPAFCHPMMLHLNGLVLDQESNKASGDSLQNNGIRVGEASSSFGKK